MKSSCVLNLERLTLSFQSSPSEGATRRRKTPVLKVNGWDSRERMRSCAAVWTAMALRRASCAGASESLSIRAARRTEKRKAERGNEDHCPADSGRPQIGD